jgi:hypothetical protein
MRGVYGFKSLLWWSEERENEVVRWYCMRTSNEDLTTRKTTEKCEDEKVSEAVFLWLAQQREKILLITGPILSQKVFSQPESDFTPVQAEQVAVNKATIHGSSASMGEKI